MYIHDQVDRDGSVILGVVLGISGGDEGFSVFELESYIVPFFAQSGNMGIHTNALDYGQQYSRTNPSHQFSVCYDGRFKVTSKSNPGIIRSHLTDTFFKTFLPSGFPDTVKSEYLEYQIYDSIQALCSYLRGILCTHALLISAGVGSENASALAAAITWVTRDGVGMISSIIFSTLFSISFGIYVKEWRLFADVINDIAQVLDFVSPWFPRYTHVYILSISAIFKTMCGISAGATKLCVTNHLCLNNNAADLNAKEGTQETAVSLSGLLLGILLARLIGTEGHYSIAMFVLLTMLHVYANYCAVSCLKLESINRPRCCLLVAEVIRCMDFIQQRALDVANDPIAADITKKDILEAYNSSDCDISIPKINSKENVWFTLQLVWGIKYHVKLGCSLVDALSQWPEFRNSTSSSKVALHEYTRFFEKCQYCIFPRETGGFSVLLKHGIKPVRMQRNNYANAAAATAITRHKYESLLMT